MKKQMSLSKMLYLLLGAFAVGFGVFAAVAYQTINQVKVDGPIDRPLVDLRNLTNDLCAPALFVVRPIVISHIMLNAPTPEIYQDAKGRFKGTEQEFVDRRAYWEEHFAEGPIKQQLRTEFEQGEQVLALINNEVIPALDKGDKEAARLVMSEKVDPVFQAHRKSADEVLAQVGKELTEKQTVAAATILNREWLLVGIGFGCAAAVAALGWWVLRLLLAQNVKDVEYCAKLTAIEKNLAVIEFNMDGTVITANDNFLKTLGYTLDEIKGRHHSMFCEEKLRNSPEYREFWGRLNRGEGMPGEYRRVSKDGKLVIIQASYNPIPDINGKFVKVVKYATDITAAALVNADYSAKLNSISKAQAVIEFTMDGTIVTANENFLKTLDYRLDEIQGRHHSMFVSESEKNSAEYREFWARLNRGENLPGEYQRFGKGGKEVWIQASYNPIADHNGNFTKVVKYATETTAAVRARHKMTEILNSVNQNAGTLGAAAEELTAVSTQMASNAEETSAQVNVVSAASEQVSKNVLTVSTGVEEMNSAIREIAKNATEAARVAQQAVSTADSANVSVSKLGESSIEIGKVIKVITSIAEQTNLLALNATIEAARAGEAGKGFAVVANEVKELAKDTARATEDISRKIETIQADTNGAIDSIQQISQVIAQINDISMTIAGAVEEQTATATEMGRNVNEAAKGTAEIAENISAVAQAAQNTTQGATNSQQAASELSRMASDLQKLGAQQGTGHTLAV